MKIAYLMHSDRKYDEVVETINQLTKQGDHVFIMINDDDLREQVQFVYMDYSRVHIFPHTGIRSGRRYVNGKGYTDSDEGSCSDRI